MTKLKRINLINVYVSASNAKAYNHLVHCHYSGFDFKQTTELLKDVGYYVPEDLYNAFNKLHEIAFDLDVGHRSEEIAED